MIAWILANWMPVLVYLLAIDRALIPIFPKVPFLVSLKNMLISAEKI